MISRVLTVLITLFWAGMTWLYVGNETNSSTATGLLTLPPEHVIEQFFQGGKDSELGIFDRQYKLGTVYLHPKRSEDGQNKLRWSGDMLLRLPGVAPQRVYFMGSTTLSAEFTPEKFELQIALRDPAIKLEITTSNKGNGYHYRLLDGDEVLREAKGSIGALLKEGHLQSAGIDVSKIADIAEPAPLIARRSSVMIHGENVAAYQLTIPHSEGLRTDIYIGQIGQVLMVRTFFGYTLFVGGLAP